MCALIITYIISFENNDDVVTRSISEQYRGKNLLNLNVIYYFYVLSTELDLSLYQTSSVACQGQERARRAVFYVEVLRELSDHDANAL